MAPPCRLATTLQPRLSSAQKGTSLSEHPGSEGKREESVPCDTVAADVRIVISSLFDAVVGLSSEDSGRGDRDSRGFQ